MRKRFRVAAVLAAAASLFTACKNPLSFDLSGPAPTPTTATVEIDASSFSPAFVLLRPGGQLTLENRDGIAHQTVSSQCPALNSALIAPGHRVSILMPSTPMTCTYQDSANPAMTGSVQLCSTVESILGPCR